MEALLPKSRDAAVGAACAVALAACLVAGALLTAGIAGAQTKAPVRAKRYKAPLTLPLTAFYDVPTPLPAGRPGQLIRSAPFGEYALPPEVNAVRILYHSRSASDQDVVTSGVVLVPEGTPPPGGWPVIAWAHGFSGAARQCAPSLMRNVYYGPFLSMYVRLGYAVVATDYTGLGTNFRNAVMDMQSNALDVIYSISAAQAAVPQLGRRWIVLGDSQGGLAAAAVAETEREIADPSYLGSIAVSGIADLRDLSQRLVQEPSPRALVFLAYAIKTVYPQFQVSDLLTEKAVPLYQQAENACALTGAGAEFSAREILKLDWQNNQFVQKFFARNTLGQKPARGPLLVISGEADPAVPIALTRQAVAQLCQQRDVVQFNSYPDLDPENVLGASVRDQIAWIQARFAGRAAPSSCQ